MESNEMRAVAEFAALAPSVHNTQPWRFVADPYRIEVRTDLERSLTYLDPSGRQLLISCGAATEFARLAVRSLGSACTVRLLPDANDETLAASLTIGFAEPVTPIEGRMIEAVARRYTDRGPYTDDPVATSTVVELREVAADRGCWLKVLDRAEDRLSAIRLLSAAEAAEAQDHEYRGELAQWRRTCPSRDGVCTDEYDKWKTRGRVADVPLRDFAGDNRHQHPGDGEPPVVERDTIVLLGTDRDDRISWLRAGRALADVLLVLTDADLVSQPLGPVMDVPSMRARLRRELGLVGHPQMLLRVGHGLGRPTSSRRYVDDVLTVVGGS